MKFTKDEIIDYYNLTEVHYRRGWKLQEAQSLHYGYWLKETKNFVDALHEMNRQLAIYGNVKAGELILDAGCGVGGSGIYLAKTYKAKVKGISLNEKLNLQACNNARNAGVEALVQFVVMDYTDTTFEDETFDIVWAMESIIHADPKSDFYKEAHRILKPGGKLIMADYYHRENIDKADYAYLMKWLHPWAINNIISIPDCKDALRKSGFTRIKNKDVTNDIRKSSWRMFYGSFYLGFLTQLYKIINPRVTHFSKNHYKAMYYQYPALRKGLWQYHFVVAEK